MELKKLKTIISSKLAQGIFVIAIGIIVGLLLLGRYEDTQPTRGLGYMGFIVLFATLIGVNMFSKGSELAAGELRKAIAISFISVFFGLMIVGNNIDKLNLEPKCVLKDTLDNFWAILSTIIAFYFGGRAIEKAKGNENEATTPKKTEE